ncbi:beta-glucan synthesis-associated protein-domain-containing protein [Phakopsora pachyrhizi]|uniref:Beta-glucan synthesis-associated protein-domain-containing protein n=1 Tax=Phakopsora pachyrhizi TaxID=170000 RepID=A0AAV0BQT7_PHAPC|nr:beta-glucan synthesis-associated protein-domain-containing protein [Phakopsora pachyrhizi]
MASGRPKEELFYAERQRPKKNSQTSNSSYSPYFMNHKLSNSSSSDSYYGRNKHEFTDRNKSRHPSDSSSRTPSNDSRIGASNRDSLLSTETDLGFMTEELLSPGKPDEIFTFKKKTRRQGASRYIIEPEGNFTCVTVRGWTNGCSLIVLTLGIIMLFAGWPILTYFRKYTWTDFVGRLSKIPGNLMKAPPIPGFKTLIDPETPASAKSRVGADGLEYELVFSDEFNTDGRTFWPGDDPYWQAADQHYWPTGDQEWYDPDGATTQGGSLVITLSKMDPSINHNLGFRSAMLTTWNKLCFTGGYFETSLILPGQTSVGGFWPAVWTMGNLGRPGYGATTDGTWPFSYNSCDVGAMPNQTHPQTGEPGPSVLTSNGDLSWQPGQKLSRCTCSKEDHPGSKNDDGSYKGRASPEIDMLEAYNYERTATAFGSQSLQMAPYNNKREWNQKLDQTYSIYDSGLKTTLNSYKGGNRQQTLSALATLPSSNFELEGNKTMPYGLEWTPDFPDSHITWSVNGKPTFTLNDSSLNADAQSMVGARLVSNEPMYLILNLGLSDTFVPVNHARLKFPAKFRFDYVRFYQPKGRKNVNCDPKDYPTDKYIKDHLNAYENVNLTTWSEAGYTFPKSTLMNGCKAPSKK